MLFNAQIAFIKHYLISSSQRSQLSTGIEMNITPNTLSNKLIAGYGSTYLYIGNGMVWDRSRVITPP